MQLTIEQLDSFNTNGFLIIRNFAKEAKCQAILDVAKVHLEHQVEPIETEVGYGERSKDYRRDVVDYGSKSEENRLTVRRLRQVYSRDILFRNWMEDEKIRPVLEQVLDDQVVITTAHHNSIMTKMPHGSTQTGWHQDRRYWHFSDDNLVSVWLALDEEHNQNGVLEFIPKSHKMDFDPEQFDEKEYFKTDHPKNMSLIETKVSTTLQRGDIVLFHSLLLHRANANRTDKPKIALVYTVKGASTIATVGTRSSQYSEILLKRS